MIFVAGLFFFQDARNTFQGSTGAKSRYPIIEFAIGKICEYLRRGRPRVRVGIRLILELTAQEPTMSFGQFRRPSRAYRCPSRPPGSEPP